jgi:Zn-dependent oligopeptidase
MTAVSRRGLLLNLYSSPLDLLKLAKDTQVYVKEVVKSIHLINGTVEEVVDKLDDISDKMCIVADSSECIRRIHGNKRWRDAADEAFNLTCSLMNELNYNRQLALKVNSLPSIGTTTELGAVIESFKRDFELFKALSDKERGQVSRLQESVDIAAVEFEALQSIGSLEKMIKLRFELAKVLGFKNPLEICLRDKQLNSHKLVMSFLKKHSEDIGKYDGCQRRFGYTTAMTIFDNLVLLSKELFNIRMEVCTDSELGNQSTVTFRVFNENDKFLGTILFDLLDRKRKDPHPTHYTIKCRKQDTEGYFVISIGLNDLESISWNESQSVFHEFGHALHSVLSETKYQVLSGTRGSVDLAEVPSSLLELIHDSTLLQARLNKNGKYEEISREKIIREEAFQVQIATLDQLLHVTEPQKDNWTRDLAHQIENEFGVKRGKDWHCSLSHLSTYGGTYFSYLFSKSVARRVKENCDMNVFKREFLEKGGTARLDFIK